MKKNLFGLILCLCLTVVCAFCAASCGNVPNTDNANDNNGSDNSQTQTNEELSVFYKEVAISAWSKLGISDPTTQTAKTIALTSNIIPDKKHEATNESDILNVKMNANSMTGVIYLLSELYANENFSTTNNVAKFSATVTLGQAIYNYDFTLYSTIDRDNGKIYLETITLINDINSFSVGNQYANLTIDYDFDAKQVQTFRMCSVSDNSMFVDMALTADDKLMTYYILNPQDEFAMAVSTAQTEFINLTKDVKKLSTSFDEEIQEYLNTVNEALAQITG